MNPNGWTVFIENMWKQLMPLLVLLLERQVEFGQTLEYESEVLDGFLQYLEQICECLCLQVIAEVELHTIRIVVMCVLLAWLLLVVLGVMPALLGLSVCMWVILLRTAIRLLAHA